MKHLASIACAVALAACTVSQADANMYQAKIAAACAMALPLSTVPSVGVYIVAGCATETAIAKLALDPSSLAWVNGLIVQAKG